MKKKVFSLFLALLLVLGCMLLYACGDKGDGNESDDSTDAQGSSGVGTDSGTDEPKGDIADGEIESVRRISATDIEIHFRDTYESDKGPQLSSIKFYIGEERCMLDTDYGSNGKVFYNNICTLRMLEPQSTDADAPAMRLVYSDDYEYDVPFENYYKHEFTTASGIVIRGSENLLLGAETLERVGAVIEMMLSESPEIAAQMASSGAQISVFGKGETIYSIPENRGAYDATLVSNEGFGGKTAGISEAAVWRWDSSNSERPDTDYITSYPNESVLVLKLAQCIKSAGIDALADVTLAGELQMVYRHAKAAGLWADTTAISSADEFFSAMTAVWYNVMGESSADDTWDGTRGPVNTRAELYNYDLVTYRFLESVYTDAALDGAWASTVDAVKLTAIPTDEPVPASADYSFLYPSSSLANVTLEYGASYKLCISEDIGFLMDTGAGYNYGGCLGLWWDYSGLNYDETPMTIIIEEVPGKEVVTRTNATTGATETVYTVYLRGMRDGYLYELDDLIYSGASADGEYAPSEFTIIFSSDSEFAFVLSGDRYLTIDPDDVPASEVIIILADETDIGWHILGLNEKTSSALFIHNGTANGSAEGVNAVAGEEIVLAATAVNSEGKAFSGWRTSNGTIANSTSRVTTFTMPEGDTVVWADYN